VTTTYVIVLVAGFVAGFAACAFFVATVSMIRRERDKDDKDDQVVLIEVALAPGSTILELSRQAKLPSVRTSYTLVRLIRAGTVRAEGGHVSLDATRYYPTPLARSVLAAIVHARR
jgi:hypothetical protein